MRALLRYTASLLLLLAIWQLAIIGLSVEPYLLPAPGAVARTLLADRALLMRAATFTLVNALVGGGIAVTLGISVGIAAASSRVIGWIVEPYLTMFQSFPRESLFPLLVVWLGFGTAPKIVSSALLAFFPVAVVTLGALRNVRHEYVGLIRSWGASRLEELLYCRLPAAVPQIIGGIKVAAPLALIGAVLGEFMGGSDGLGHLIVASGSTFRIDRIFACITLLSLLGSGMVGAVHLLEQFPFRRFYRDTHDEATRDDHA